MSIRSDNRIDVLVYSLFLEKQASFSLAYLLNINIEEINTTKSLGNTSSSLSFNQKINLLLDNKSITKEDKSKLECIMSVRNQFLHNFHANNYTDCASVIDGLEKYLKKLYPDPFKDHDLETAIQVSVNNLFLNCLEILNDFKGGTYKKLETESRLAIIEKRHDALEKSIDICITDLVSQLDGLKEAIIPKEEIVIKLNNLRYDIRMKALKLTAYD